MTKYAPHTQTEALARAEAKIGKSNQVGMCAHEVIVNIFGIPAPWKWGGNGRAWAVNYFKGAQKVVKTSDPAKVPAGAMVFFDARPGATTNGGRAGHVAVGAGNGNVISTDLPREGRWGKVSIRSVESTWGKKLLGYVLVDGMGYTLTDKPVPKPPKPARWFGIDLRNLAGFNDHGEDSWNARYFPTLRDIRKVGREVVVVLELPNPKVERFVASMDAIGYDHAGGYNGRHIFPERGCKVLKTKKFSLSPDLHGDDKAAFAAVLQPTAHDPIIVACTQLENEDLSGSTQVAQARTFRSIVLAWAEAQDVPEDRVFFALDGNSDSRVYNEVFKPAGFLDTAATAWSSENSAWRTFVGWFRKPTKGKRIDLILAHKLRPVARFRVRTQTGNLSDHLDVFADIGKR